MYSCTGVGLALLGYGVWSLVWAPLTGGVVTLGLSVVLARFIPALSFSPESLKKMIGFGGKLTLKNVFVYLSRQADKFLVPKFLGAEAAGLYSRAFNYSSIPDARFIPLLYSVCFPVFSKLRANREKFLEWYEKISAMIAVAVVPLLLGLCALAEDFTLTLFGPNSSGWSAHFGFWLWPAC